MFKNLSRLDITRKVCYLYYFMYVVLALADNNFGPVGYAITIALGALFVAQFISKGNKVDIAVGILFTMISFYLILAVTSDLIDYYNGSKPVRNFAEYFGFGYGIFGSATAASLIVIYCYYARRRSLENRKALQV